MVKTLNDPLQRAVCDYSSRYYHSIQDLSQDTVTEHRGVQILRMSFTLLLRILRRGQPQIS